MKNNLLTIVKKLYFFRGKVLMFISKQQFIILFGVIFIIFSNFVYDYQGQIIGRIPILYEYTQKNNARYLIDSNQSSRIFPHRVDSIGKLKDIWNNGFRSFEVDVRFGDNNTSKFFIGHNLGDSKITLEKFLSSIKYNNIERVWLDFKNLNKDNYKDASIRLEYLDRKFKIKNKFIVESGNKMQFFKFFNISGWHTSYYMPTNIVKLIKEHKNIEMEQLSLKISKQVKMQNVSAISFDSRLYPFVKKYMEPKISKNIVYHIWYAPFLASFNFKSELLSNKLFLDERVKTLLTIYRSKFNI